MGRLQRYIRRLTASEWEELHADARKQLRGKTLALLERLRSTGAPQVLTPTEKELAQRLERWIWRRSYLEHNGKIRTFHRPPAAWVLMGARLYLAKGLLPEALAILKPQSPSQLENIQLLLWRLVWEMERGRLEGAMRTLRLLRTRLGQLRWEVERWRVQLWLHRLLREYGGSYTLAGQRVLKRIARSPLWHTAWPTEKERRVFHLNVHITYLIAQGRIETALQLADPNRFPPRPEWLLNRWLCQLMLRRSLEETQETTLSYMQGGFSPLSGAILVNRTLLTLLQKASPTFLREYRPQLERWMQRYRLYQMENRFVWAQLLWLAGDSAAAAREFERVKPSMGRFFVLQARLLSLLLSIDSRDWVATVRQVRRLLHLLRVAEQQIASAALLRRLARRLYWMRMSPRVLPKAVALWARHLDNSPTERFFWNLTLLPDWLQAQLKRQRMCEYRTHAPESTKALSDLMTKVGELLD